MNSLDLFPKLLWLLCSLTCSNIIFPSCQADPYSKKPFWLFSQIFFSKFQLFLLPKNFSHFFVNLTTWLQSLLLSFCCHFVVILTLPLSPCSLGRTFPKHHHLFTFVGIIGPNSFLQPRHYSLFSIIWNYSLVVFLQGSSQVFHLHFFSP